MMKVSYLSQLVEPWLSLPSPPPPPVFDYIKYKSFTFQLILHIVIYKLWFLLLHVARIILHWASVKIH